jgi:DNA-binding response OmpR family regulator
MSVGEGRKVLALEDDPALQTLIRKQLTAHGFEVVVAGDGLEGLMKIETFIPDVIVCDLMMPNLDGLGFVRAIKSKKETAALPVIFLTAKTDPKSMMDGINVGGKFYVTKPFQIEELLTKISKALAK